MTVFKPRDRVHLKHHARTRATTGTVVNAERFAGGHVFVRWDDNQAVTSHLPHVLEPAGEPMTDHFKLAEYLIEERENFAPKSVASAGLTSMLIAGTVNVSTLAETFLQWQGEKDANRDAFRAEAVALYRAYYRCTYGDNTVLEWSDFDHDQATLATELATTARELHPESNR